MNTIIEFEPMKSESESVDSGTVLSFETLLNDSLVEKIQIIDEINGTPKEMTQLKQFLNSQKLESLQTEQALRAEVEKLKLENTSLKAQNKKLGEALTKLCRRERAMAIEVERVRELRMKEVTKLTVELTESDAQMRKVAEVILKREGRMSSYFKAFTEKNVALDQLLKELSEEIESASLLNPAQEYLKMNELEVARLRSELSKASGKESVRKEVDFALLQLNHHREYLRSVCERTKKQSTSQLEKLKQMMESSQNGALPPFLPLVDELKVKGEK